VTRKFPWEVLKFRRSEGLGLTLKTSAFESLRWPIHIIKPVDKTKLSCYTPHRRSTTVSLETYLSKFLKARFQFPEISSGERKSIFWNPRKIGSRIFGIMVLISKSQ